MSADLYQRAHDGIETPIVISHPRCSGPCDQGRKPCVCPDACEVARYDSEGEALILWLLIAVLVVLGVIALVHVFARAG